MNSILQYSTFYIEENLFGIEVTRVQEVLLFQEMTRVPLAPKMVMGLLNLRGKIVTTLDMRERLKLPPVEGGDAPTNVVVQTNTGGLMSLLVDKIGDVIEVDENSFEDIPKTIQGEAREVLSGVHKLKDELLLVLNVDKINNLEIALD